MPRRDTSRFGFPPERDPFEPFPGEVPWGTPISELQWWLEVTIFEPFWSARLPLPLLAARHGWQLTLRDILPRLHRDGRPPDQVILIAGGGVEFRSHDRTVEYHLLLGPPPKFRD